jgi:hypothetical protein
MNLTETIQGATWTNPRTGRPCYIAWMGQVVARVEDIGKRYTRVMYNDEVRQEILKLTHK